MGGKQKRKKKIEMEKNKKNIREREKKYLGILRFGPGFFLDFFKVGLREGGTRGANGLKCLFC